PACSRPTTRATRSRACSPWPATAWRRRCCSPSCTSPPAWRARRPACSAACSRTRADAMATRIPRLRLAACVALVLALAGCKVELYSGLNETEANEVVAALADGRIAARKEHMDGADWQVQVDEDRVGAALELLRAQGLPAQHYASMGDMFQKQGLVSTPAEERMRYIFAV